MRDCQYVLVFGGTFDPPTVAHVVLPLWVRKRVGADGVAFVPAARSPLKRDQPVASADQRLAMLRLALEDHEEEAFIVTDELDRVANDGMPSYTHETLTQLDLDLQPGARMRLLLGADQLRDFERWKEPQKVIELGDPLVMLRPPQTRASVLAAINDEPEEGFWASRLIDVEPMDVSATEVRRRVAAGEPFDELVPQSVATYIREEGLYQG